MDCPVNWRTIFWYNQSWPVTGQVLPVLVMKRSQKPRKLLCRCEVCMNLHLFFTVYQLLSRVWNAYNFRVECETKTHTPFVTLINIMRCLYWRCCLHKNTQGSVCPQISEIISLRTLQQHRYQASACWQCNFNLYPGKIFIPFFSVDTNEICVSSR